MISHKITRTIWKISKEITNFRSVNSCLNIFAELRIILALHLAICRDYLMSNF